MCPRGATPIFKITPIVFTWAGWVANVEIGIFYISLSKNGLLKDPTAFHQLIFEEYHNRGNRLTSKAAIERLFARAGIESDDFNRTWNSFEVNQALRIAQDLARRYNVMSVPMVVVNGKYQTDVSQSGGIPQLFEVIDELIEREGVR